MKNIDPENLVFIDETGIILGLIRTHTGSNKGTRIYEMKPSYISQKVTVIGTAVIQKVVQLMTINNSIATIAFKVFIEIFLWLELWPGAVVVMDNLPAHKLGSIQFLNNFSINFE